MTLQVKNIQKTFESFVALTDVSFTAKQGEFITLLGSSGCGKTTLLNIIAGFIPATSGTVMMGGDDISHVPPEDRDTAMCFQSYALFPHLSVAENIKFGLEQKKVDKAEIKDRLDEMLKQVDLADHAHKLPNALSGGQQQRVALARALIVRPSVILFDEPLSNLDAKLRDKLRVNIRNLQKEFGFTAIYVTHDQSEALAMSDRVVLLNQGKTEQIGTPHEIYRAPKTTYVADFIGGANIHQGDIAYKGKTATLKTEFGSLTAPVPSGSSKPKNAHICWRAEDVEIVSKTTKPTTSKNILSGTVDSLFFQGSHTDVFVKNGDKTVRLEVRRGVDIAENDTVHFSIPVDCTVLIEGK